MSSTLCTRCVLGNVTDLQDELAASLVRDSLTAILVGNDKNNDCKISKDEFEQMLLKHDATKAMRQVGVDVVRFVWGQERPAHATQKAQLFS